MSKNYTSDQLITSFLNDAKVDFDEFARLFQHAGHGAIAYREILGSSRQHEDRILDTAKLDWHPIRALTLCYLLDDQVCDLQIESAFIFQDLVRNRRDKLLEYIRFDRYTDYKVLFNRLLKDSFTLLGAVLNGIEQEDDGYCRQLMYSIVKIYFKKQYKDIKRLKVLTEDSLELISEVRIDLDTLDILQCRPLAFIIYCSKIFGYTLSKYILPIYSFIEELYKSKIADYESPELITDSALKKAHTFIEDHSKDIFGGRIRSGYVNVNSFLVAASMIYEPLAFGSLPEELFINNQDTQDLVNTICLMDYVGLDTSNIEKIQEYHMFFNSVASLSERIATDENALLTILGVNEDEAEEFPDRKFDASRVNYQERVINQKPQSERIQEKKQEKEQEQLLYKGIVRELEAARQEIRRLKQNISVIHENEKKLREEAAELAARLDEKDAELTELKGRGEIFINAPEEDKIIVPLQEMKDYVRGKEVCLIGGHDNWIKKVRAEFPDWKYIGIGGYQMKDVKFLREYDYIYFFTDHIDHCTYGKMLREIRESKLPLGYIHTINLDQVTERIYYDLRAREEMTEISCL